MTLTFDLLTLTVFQTNFDYPTIIGYWVTNYWIWSHFRYRAVTAHVAYNVTYHRGQKWSTFFKSLTRTMLSPKHSVLSNFECYKVHNACTVSRDLYIRESPKTTCNNFLTPELSIHYTTFMGLRWWLRVVYMGAHHVKAVFGRKETYWSAVIIDPKIMQFFKTLRV